MMKKKLVAGFMAATMMVSVMSTGVFAKDLDPSDENKKAGDTQVTVTVGKMKIKQVMLYKFRMRLILEKYSSLRQKEMYIQPMISQYLVSKQIIWRQEMQSLF